MRVRTVTSALRRWMLVDNVTHGLCGVSIYGVWLLTDVTAAHTAIAAGVLAAALIGSEAPDFDYVVQWAAGPVAYLRQHRAISHSLPLWLLWPLLISVSLNWVVPHHFMLLYTVACVGVLVHVLLDGLTGYGTQLLWPLTRRRYRLDILYTVDLVWWACGLLFAGLRWIGVDWQQTLTVCLTLAAANLVIRCLFRFFLSRSLPRRLPASAKWSLHPGPVFWWWSYVSEDGGVLTGGRIDRFGRPRPEVELVDPHPQTALTQFVFRESAAAATFLDLARRPMWRVARDGVWTRVTMADACVRFGRMLPFTVMVAVVGDDENTFELVQEKVRAQSMDLTDLAKDVASGGGKAQRPRIV